MSVDNRLRQVIVRASAHLEATEPIDVESALSSVRASAERRQKFQLVAMAAAALAIVLAAFAAPDLGRLLTMELDVPPAEQDDQDGEDRVDRDDRDELEVDRRHGVQAREDVFGPSRNGKAKRSPASASGVVSESSTDEWHPDESRTEEAPRSGSRTEGKPYNAREPVVDATSCWAARVGCDSRVEFKAWEKERWVSVMIYESQGRPVSAYIRIDVDGAESIRFCTSTPSPVRIPPGSVVEVVVRGAGCSDATPNPSSGRVEATFFTAKSG